MSIMDKKSYTFACKFIMKCATSFIKKGKKEFGDKRLEGGWFIFRVQILPTSNIQKLISSIPKTVFKKVGVAYNYDNLYFFHYLKKLRLFFRVYKS